MNEIQYESLQETAAMADAVNEVEQALRALHEGRNDDCFPLWSDCGKDADLEPGGCYGISEVIRATEDAITFKVSAHAHVAPPEPAFDDDDNEIECACAEILGEVVCWAGIDGDWSGDDWCLYCDHEITIPWTEGTEMVPDAVMAERAIEAAKAALADYWAELALVHKAFDEQYAYHTANCEVTKTDEPGVEMPDNAQGR